MLPTLLMTFGLLFSGYSNARSAQQMIEGQKRINEFIRSEQGYPSQQEYVVYNIHLKNKNKLSMSRINPDIDEIKIRMYSDLGLETVLQINMHGQYRSLVYVLHRAEKTVEDKEDIGQVRNDFLVKITPVLMRDSKGYRFKIRISRMNKVISMIQGVKKNNDEKNFEIDIRGKEESKYQNFKMDDSEYQIGISLR